MWSRVKKVFKKKPKKDTNIEKNEKDEFVLRDVTPYKVEPDTELGSELCQEEHEQVAYNLRMHTKFIGRAENGDFEWKVNGTTIVAPDIFAAHRKYFDMQERKK